jgi:hypothetical protein
MAQKIKFVTDSASDIPRSLREELDILVLPFPIAMGAREYQDGVDFTATEFYDMLLAAPQIPTHAQLTPFVFSQCFEEAFRQGYTDLIYTSINSKGSATHQNALQAREEDLAIIHSPVGMPGRAVRTPLIQRLEQGLRFPPKHCSLCMAGCQPAQVPFCITHALIQAVKGNREEGLFFSGSNVGKLDRMLHVRELMDELMKDWRAFA